MQKYDSSAGETMSQHKGQQCITLLTTIMSTGVRSHLSRHATAEPIIRVVADITHDVRTQGELQ